MTAAPSMRLHARPQHNPRPLAERRWALWAALLPTLAAVLLFGAVRPAVNAGVEVAFYIGATFVLLRCWRRPDLLPLRWVLAPMLGFVLLILAQWALRWSLYPAVTLDGLAQLVAYGCVFYLGLIAFADSQNLRLAARVLVIFAAFVSAEAIVQKFTTGGMIYGLRDATMDARPIGPFTYHNYFAAFVELLLPLALVIAFNRTRTADWSVLLRRLTAPALMLAAFFVAESRGGALVLLVELVLGGALLWRARKRLSRQRSRLALVAAVLLGFTLLVGWGPFMRRWGNVSRDVSAGDRLQLSLSCLAIWRAHPWKGSGLNTFPQVYPQHRRFDDGRTVLQAHDDVAQLLAETGTVGFGLALLVLVAVGFGAAKALRHSREPEIRRYKIAVLLGCIGFLVHCGMDFVSHNPALTYLFWLLAALLLAATVQNHARRHKPASPAQSFPSERAE